MYTAAIISGHAKRFFSAAFQCRRKVEQVLVDSHSFFDKAFAAVYPEMQINSVDCLVADSYRSIKQISHIVTLAGQKEGYVQLTSCQTNDCYRNEAASGQGGKNSSS